MMIPVCEPWFPGKEEEYAADAVKNRMISGAFGTYVNRFEESFAKYCGTQYGVACSNGLAALHLALLAIDLKEGDEVIAPTFTMVASTNAIIFTGAKPVLVDSDPETYCIDVSKIEEKITSKTKAIIAVHIYGHPCDMDAIEEIAKKHNLIIIEDAAEAHGAEYNGKKVGSLSKISCFSFYANKIITTGEGGMCLTNDKALADKMYSLRDHGFSVPRFKHAIVGYNYRLSNINAAIGLAQVENAELLVESRRNVGLIYTKKLAHLKDHLILPVEKDNAKNVYWMYGIILRDTLPISKEKFMEELDKRGIQTRGFFIPMHQQPAYINKTAKNVPDCDGEYPVSDMISGRGLYIPSSSNLDEAKIDFICKAIESIINSSLEKGQQAS